MPLIRIFFSKLDQNSDLFKVSLTTNEIVLGNMFTKKTEKTYHM